MQDPSKAGSQKRHLVRRQMIQHQGPSKITENIKPVHCEVTPYIPKTRRMFHTSRATAEKQESQQQGLKERLLKACELGKSSTQEAA
jgi:hypothetical protein